MAKTKQKDVARKSMVPVAIQAGVGARVAATLSAAAAAGLTAGSKGKRVSGRAHERLFEAAAERSGLEGSELIEYALAKVALEDDFAAKLLAREGRVGRDVDLEF
ncbi:MAG: hypothetical protein ACXW27_14360 [Allosphingosinicella sp.]